jgi:hypothetical protein
MPENIEKTKEITTYYTNQDVYDELQAHMNQFDATLDSYKEALEEYNAIMNERNNYVEEYNGMSYSQQTSSSVQDKKNTYDSDVGTAAKNLVIQCEVMEAQIDEFSSFLEENKKLLINSGKLDTSEYLEVKSMLVEIKARVRTNKQGAEDTIEAV